MSDPAIWSMSKRALLILIAATYHDRVDRLEFLQSIKPFDQLNCVFEAMLRYNDSGYMEEDRSSTLYQLTFSVLGVAIVIVILRREISILILLKAALILRQTFLSLASPSCPAFDVIGIFDHHIALGWHCLVPHDSFSDSDWNGKAHRILTGPSCDAPEKYEGGAGPKQPLPSANRVTLRWMWPCCRMKSIDEDSQVD